MQSKLKKTRTTTEVAESRSAGRVAITKEEDDVDGVQPAASLTFSEECKMATKMFVEGMALTCSIYDVDFKNLAEGYKLGAGENIVGKVGFLLVDPSYNVRMDRMHLIRSMM